MSEETIIIRKDGDSWVAYRESFENLQESIAGVGDNEAEALTDLLDNEAREEVGL